MKVDLKGATRLDTPKLVAKTDLARLKAHVGKLDIDKLQTASADLSKLSNVVDNDIVKKFVYDKSVTKVNANDTKVSSH